MSDIDLSVPWRRDPSRWRDRLVDWFRHVLSDGADPEVSGIETPPNTGMSSETILVDVTWREHEPQSIRFVVRLAPDPSHTPVFPAYDLELQQRCMQVVGAHTAVPVPEARWYEPDPAWLGCPFLVMTHVEGTAPPDIPPYVFGGWVVDASPEDRARMQHNAVGLLADLHRLTPESADLSFLDRPEHGVGALGQHLGYQRAYYEWAREGVRYPVIERAFEWLHEHRPEEGAPVINWGDARIGNILFREFEPVAALDWEMAALGPPEVDVAWMIWMHRFFQDLAEGYGLPGLPAFMQRDAVTARYEELTGRVLCDMKWYEAFAALRMAIITVRTSMRTVVYGQSERPKDPDELIGFRHLVDRMLDGSYWE